MNVLKLKAYVVSFVLWHPPVVKLFEPRVKKGDAGLGPRAE